MSIDNKVEKYYSYNPYSYALNNPIKFVDPDGNDIKIFYGRDNSQSFIFNGTNGNIAPNDAFVQSVVKAYNYNIGNGGGKNLMEAATNHNLNIQVKNNNGWGSEYNTGNQTVYWDADRAVEGEFMTPLSYNSQNEYWISPATILEHEFDHAVFCALDPKSFYLLLHTKDDQYDNKEEKRVITGSERETAIKNKEINKYQVRKNHEGNLRKVDNSTENKPVSERLREDPTGRSYLIYMMNQKKD